MTRAIVRVEALEVRFADTRLFGDKRESRAVDGVSFEVAPGEVFCIAGESGCGKTTLGRSLLGLVRPRSGTVEVAGAFPSALRGRELSALRRKVQMIFQDPMGALNPRQTVYDAIAEAVRIHDLPGHEEELVNDALHAVGLRPPERFFLRYPHELSGGQRQRVVIAAAMVLQPEVVVADEPVSMLDASVRGEILRLLLDLKERMGLTLIVVTHDLGFAWAVADRVAVMYLGKIVEIGPAEQVLTSPQHPYTKALLSVAPEIGERRRLEVLTGEPPDPRNVPPGCRFHPRCPVVRSGEAGALEPACRGAVPPLEELAPGQEAACHVAAAAAATASSRSRPSSTP